MTIIENDMSNVIQLLNDKVEEYKNIFGRNSLDYVIICDPRLMDVDNFNSGIKKLEEAIKNNKPIEPIPKEIWENLIFYKIVSVFFIERFI